MPGDGQPDRGSMRVEFADGRFSEEEAAANAEWREMTPYERAILGRLLEVDFEGRAEVADEARNVFVRQIDRCGCLEFLAGVEAVGEIATVAEGSGPGDERGVPVEISLTLRGGHLLWLEFHRYGGRNDYWPEPDDFRVSACS